MLSSTGNKSVYPPAGFDRCRSRASTGFTAVVAVIMLFALFSRARADNATIPVKLTTPFPTITNLAVEWTIRGDDNLNCTVEVQYRMAGELEWQKGMPLVRVPADNTGDRTWPTFRWDNKLSGSILDLRPGTEYEIRLALSDPDGGKADTTVKVRTRPVPRDWADQR